MRAFFQRYHERSLTSEDQDKIFWFLFIIPYGLLSFGGMVLIDAEHGSISNVVFKLAVEVFFLPWFIFIWAIAAHSLPKKPSIQIKVFRLVIAVVYALVAALAGAGYFNLTNALTGSNQPVLVSGPITEMKAESGRWAGKLHNITVRYGDRDVMLTVTPQEFAQLKTGEMYSREMKLGGLGYYYTWGLAFWK